MQKFVRFVAGCFIIIHQLFREERWHGRTHFGRGKTKEGRRTNYWLLEGWNIKNKLERHPASLHQAHVSFQTRI